MRNSKSPDSLEVFKEWWKFLLVSPAAISAVLAISAPVFAEISTVVALEASSASSRVITQVASQNQTAPQLSNQQPINEVSSVVALKVFSVFPSSLSEKENQEPTGSEETVNLNVSEVRQSPVSSNLQNSSPIPYSLLPTPQQTARLMPQVASQDQTVPQLSNQQPINEVRQLSRRTNYIARVTSVSKLSDVQPSDWAFQALQSLIERYGVIEGYPDGTFRGNRAMTRYEFAAALNAALDRVSELINAGLANQISRQDLETLQRLQAEFAKELKVLVGRVDSLEARTARMEATQFSTTTKLNGEAIFAINGGIGNPGGRETDPNTIFFSRVRLNLTTSFTGRDQLLTQLQASTSTPVARLSRVAGVGTDAAGSLADNASALFYSSLIGGTGFQLSRLSYTFPLSDDFKVSFFPRGFASDYIDFNRYSNKRNPDNFSTEALTNNILLFAQDFPSAGAAVTWNINNGPLTFRAVYAAQDATVPEPTGLTNLPAGLGSITDVYGNPGGDNRGGLFGDPYLGFLELEFAPSSSFAVRLQYVDGAQGGKKYRAVGANFEYAISPNLGVFGRFGYAPEFTPIPIPGIEPTYWQAGIAVSDLFVPRDSGGISVAQPLIFQDPITGTDRTQTNYEVFYNFPVGNNIRITPLVQIITDPLNNSENGTIYTGTLRSVFSF